jgi:plastocyanin
MRAGVSVVFLLACAVCASQTTAQSLLERTPNLSGGWVGAPNTLHFHFLHRFNHSGPPTRQVQNRPTFLLAWTTPWPVVGGVQYATRSALVAGVPNEWELFVRGRLLAEAGGAPLDAAVQLGYNAAARSVDAELSAARPFGRFRVIAGARALTSAVGGDATAVMLAGGVVSLHEHMAIAADIAADARSGRRAVWGAGLHVRLPATPHTLSLQVTNADATTLHAASVAGERLRWGFEFTVPVTPARYLGRTASAGTARTVLDTVATVMLHNLRFTPDTLRVRAGTTVVWRNTDPLPHSVTAADGSWDSGDIAPGAGWRRRFDTPGTHEIVCRPHPFMGAVVIVE